MAVLQDNYDSLPSLERVYQAAMVNVLPRPEIVEKRPDTSELGYYMDPNILFVDANCNPQTLIRIFAVGSTASVAVIHVAGKIVGVITKKYLEQPDKKEIYRKARDLMIPWHEIITVNLHDDMTEVRRRLGDDDFLLVMKNGHPVGALWQRDLPELDVLPAGGYIKPAPDEFARIFDLFPEGLIIIGPDLRIIYANNAAVKVFGTEKEAVEGRMIYAAFGHYFSLNYREYKRCSPVFEVLKNLQPIYKLERLLLCGRTFQMNYLPVVSEGRLDYLVLSFRDVSEEREVIEFNQTAYKEMTEAFRVMLPTTKIEKKLRSIPEYQDVFNPTTGYVEIIEVIPDGAFRHVINCLNIVSELHKKGLFNDAELKRSVVVQALLLHDIGKKQPVLEVGDVVDPKIVFPDGKKHACVSAGIIGSYPLISPEVVPLIFYHHHHEEELPDDFPDLLLPMWRLVKVVDGLSAALTRRHARLDMLVEGSRIIVLEKNPHPYYNGVREMDILTGKSYFHRDSL